MILHDAGPTKNAEEADQDRSGRVKGEWHGSFHNLANPAHGSPVCIPSDLIPGF